MKQFIFINSPLFGFGKNPVYHDKISAKVMKETAHSIKIAAKIMYF
jgi:hypothetical protein